MAWTPGPLFPRGLLSNVFLSCKRPNDHDYCLNTHNTGNKRKYALKSETDRLYIRMRRMSIRRAYFNCKKRSIYCESVVVNRSALSVKYSRKTLALSTDVMTRNMLHYSFSDGVHHPLMLLDHLKYCQSFHLWNANMHWFIPAHLKYCQSFHLWNANSTCFLYLTLCYCIHPNSMNHLNKYF